MVFKIFISYSQFDFFDRARKIYNYLSSMFPNDDIFIDQAKTKAKKWREENDRKLIECHLVILILTPAALQSNEVKREIKIANDMKKLILPCKMNVLHLEWDELELDIGSLDGIPFKAEEDLQTSLFGEISKIRNEFYMLENITGTPIDPITVSVDKSTYSDGDTIIISGEVKELLSNTPISIVVVDTDDHIVALDQVEIDSKKKYSTELTAGGTMKDKGNYTVKARYGNKSDIAKTSFVFLGSSVTPKSFVTEDTIIVEGKYPPIKYRITDGKVLNVIKDPGTTSLITTIQSENDGEITLTIPRILLDAKVDNVDDDFFVLVDGMEARFDEVKTDTERILTIPFPSNSDEIEIVGISQPTKSSQKLFEKHKETPENTEQRHVVTLSVSFDRTVYPLNSKVYVRVNCPYILYGKNIELVIFNSKNKTIASKQLDPSLVPDSDLKRAGIYEEFFLMNHSDWNLGEVYTIRASHGNASAEDSCTIDERTPVIQTDKSVYLAGTNMILTVIDPDADKDSQKQESVGNTEESFLTISSSMGKLTGYKLTETGDSTGIFQGIIGLIGTHDDGTKIPYVDNEHNISKTQGNGPDNGFIQVKQSDEIKITYKRKSDTTVLTAFASNFGAMIELDQKVYTWTDKVRIAVVAPSFIKDPNKIEKIGNDSDGTITIKTRTSRLEKYELIETGPGTGIFVGEVRLSGFQYDKIPSDMINDFGKSIGNGPNDGILSCNSDDGISVELATKNETIVGSALIRWNIGEIQWMNSTYSLGDTGSIRVIDPDMNFNPNLIEIFKIRVWSDSDPVGTEILVVETGPEKGIFVGDISFGTKTEEGISLKVSPGDSVIAEYVDFTLPDPYKNGDELKITATTGIIPYNSDK
ncbi:MAG: toll/interleukin-1 receptor domain-containing protein [Nitrosopumilus sp.]|uniref:toll/interleukin-1 receptor domain-containing protein n=1 Tax=Nitrosopumilus sp. TaxID=2024843 RepID=UPI00242A811C|nr:toll/interleukin-1 receptor domain-containing protein [Nitrosopumilus sp.]MCV0365658.1 toll/interleukin-1 receptor domain-containing protein [Nitrosopumilus sp.]